MLTYTARLSSRFPCETYFPLQHFTQYQLVTESGALSTLRAGRRVGSSGTLVDDHKLPLEQRAKSAVAESPRFVVLDFRHEIPCFWHRFAE